MMDTFTPSRTSYEAQFKYTPTFLGDERIDPYEEVANSRYRIINVEAWTARRCYFILDTRYDSTLSADLITSSIEVVTSEWRKVERIIWYIDPEKDIVLLQVWGDDEIGRVVWKWEDTHIEILYSYNMLDSNTQVENGFWWVVRTGIRNNYFFLLWRQTDIGSWISIRDTIGSKKILRSSSGGIIRWIHNESDAFGWVVGVYHNGESKLAKAQLNYNSEVELLNLHTKDGKEIQYVFETYSIFGWITRVSFKNQTIFCKKRYK